MGQEGLSIKQIGDRLRSAREALGYSTRVVARQLALRGFPVSHATIANYERGSTTPGAGTIRVLAEFYGKAEDWFLGSGPVLSGIRYRCLKAVKVSEKRAFESESAGWLQAYVELENVLDDSLETLLTVDAGRLSGARLAAKVREALGLSEMQPVPSMIDVLERFGIRVIQVASEARIDALAGNFGEMPAVVLNATLSNDRLRFDAGHELWHVLTGDCDDDVSLSDKDMDGPAHDFSSHLLLSDAALADAFRGNSMVRLVQFKERYGISLAAMVYRARKADLIPQSLYERLWREFTRLGWRKQEPGYVPPDRPTRLEEMIDTAVKDLKKLSFADVARFAGTTEAVVRQRWLAAMGGGSLDQESSGDAPTLRIGGGPADRSSR
ncbi:MAG: ImmA/IrrE family metallo-endopeptidase [Phycisphaerales bacterium]|nr:ImmA/IrrE family metallo-endopeptidase [Phycisphaerales bacterium]